MRLTRALLAVALGFAAGSTGLDGQTPPARQETPVRGAQPEAGTFSMALTGDSTITRRLSLCREPSFLKLIEIVRDEDVGTRITSRTGVGYVDTTGTGATE